MEQGAILGASFRGSVARSSFARIRDWCAHPFEHRCSAAVSGAGGTNIRIARASTTVLTNRLLRKTFDSSPKRRSRLATRSVPDGFTRAVWQQKRRRYRLCCVDPLCLMPGRRLSLKRPSAFSVSFFRPGRWQTATNSGHEYDAIDCEGGAGAGAVAHDREG